MNYAEMTIEQLEQENQILMAKRAEILATQRQIAMILSQKVAEQKAQKTFDSMSNVEKQALKQTVMASGIESQEQVEGIQ